LVKLQADGLLALVLEHEVDHLNGILYFDHLKSGERLVKQEAEPQADHTHESERPVNSEQEHQAHRANDHGGLAQPELGLADAPASLRVR